MSDRTPIAVFDQLAWLYLNEPDASMFGTLNTVFPGLRLREADLAAIRQDYHDLFTVPVSGRYLPPYASAQRAGRLWGPITHHVADWYLVSGFNPAALQVSSVWQMHVIPDHIGYELAFYGALLAHNEDVAARFYAGHIATWVPTYAAQVVERALTPVYRLVGELTAEAVRNG